MDEEIERLRAENTALKREKAEHDYILSRLVTLIEESVAAFRKGAPADANTISINDMRPIIERWEKLLASITAARRNAPTSTSSN
jgi:hypothetical protein